MAQAMNDMNENLAKLKSIMSGMKIKENPSIREYKVRYHFGAWYTSHVICCESDAEAIHDASELSIKECLPCALWCGNRMVKPLNGIEAWRAHGIENLIH